MTNREDLMIALLARIAFPDEKLRMLVAQNKRDRNAYIRGYNACDGRRAVNEIAKIVGVTSGTLVPILQDWERLGIIYEVQTELRGKFYRCLYTLEEE